MFPEKTVEAIKEEALAKRNRCCCQSLFCAGIACALNQAAGERDLSEEELVSIAMEEWVVLKGYLKSV